MKVFVIFSVLLGAAYANECFKTLQEPCGKNWKTNAEIKSTDLSRNCNSKTGHFLGEEKHLQNYAKDLIEKSYEYLLLSVNFGQFKNNRDGLKTYYRKLSDQAWEDAVDLIKYITKRGGKMEFGVQTPSAAADEEHENNEGEQSNAAGNEETPAGEKRPNNKGRRSRSAGNEETPAEKEYKLYSLSEIKSLAKALEMQKSLANEALHLYSESLKLHTYGTKSHMDGSIAHYLEEKFIEPQMNRVRELAGHFNDLQQMLRADDPAISVFMFDEFLKKSL